MEKKVMASAVVVIAAGFTVAIEAVAAPKVWGFADIVYSAVDESADVPGGKNTQEGKFNADVEVDMSLEPANGVTARADFDFNTNDEDSSAEVEQAMFDWDIRRNLHFSGGIFNNPIGNDAEDAVDMEFTTHSVIYNILDQQTARVGNNLSGMSLSSRVEDIGIRVGILNDLANTDEEQSLLMALDYIPVRGLTLEMGVLTQANVTDNPDSLEDMVNLNASYRQGRYSGGLDFLRPSEVIDNAYSVWAGLQTTPKTGIKLRYEAVGWDAADVDDTTATSIYGYYQAKANLAIALEVKDVKNDLTTDTLSGLRDGTLSQLEFITTF